MRSLICQSLTVVVLALAVLSGVTLAATRIGHPDALPDVPGAGLVTGTLDLLHLDKVYVDFFKTSYDKGHTSPDGKWRIPDGVEFSSGGSTCSFAATSFFASTWSDYKNSMSHGFSVGGSLGKLSGSYSQEFRSAKAAFFKHSQQVTQVGISCDNWLLVNSKPTIAPNVVNQIARLPKHFDSTTQAQYFKLFETVKPFVVTQCRVGGKLSQEAFTTSSYASHSSSSELKSQATLSIFFTVSENQSYKNQESAGWSAATSVSTIMTRGGNFPAPGPNAWSAFAKSVQQDYANLACNSYHAQPITDFFDLDSKLKHHTEAMINATNAYYIRMGCTNPAAPNFNKSATVDDGSCDTTTAPAPPPPPPPKTYTVTSISYNGGSCGDQTGATVYNSGQCTRTPAGEGGAVKFTCQGGGGTVLGQQWESSESCAGSPTWSWTVMSSKCVSGSHGDISHKYVCQTNENGEHVVKEKAESSLRTIQRFP